MKRLTFPKAYFTRDKERDFFDDGNCFRMYKYKNVLPISVLHSKEIYYGGESSIFCDIRLDYLGFRYHEYKEDDAIIDKYNGVSNLKFDMNDFIENCEFIKIFN